MSGSRRHQRRPLWPKPTRHGLKGLKNRIFRHPLDHCHWCQCPLAFREATVDHVLARSEGGTHALDNLVIACFACNQQRSHDVARRCAVLVERYVRLKTAIQINDVLGVYAALRRLLWQLAGAVVIPRVRKNGRDWHVRV